MPSPYLTIDLDKIEHNARNIAGLCRTHGIAVAGVTKGVCGNPEIALAMLRGGVASIADSRMENIDRLKRADVTAPIMLLRVPALSAVEEVVGNVASSLNSELSVLAGLSQAALHLGRLHEVVVMVDLGDLREGVWPTDLVPFVREALCLPGIRIAGLGTNLACFGGVIPSEEKMDQLVALAEELESSFGLRLDLISGVNSSGLTLLASGRMPRRVNHARIGEAILLGRETVQRKAWPGTHQDAFTLRAEILEMKRKPSVPLGERGLDAFGEQAAFPDHGKRWRALLNIGREDADIGGLTPLQPGVAILGASSGYLVADVTELSSQIAVGDELAFSLNYGALLAAMTSKYVKKYPIGSGRPAGGEGPVK